MTTDPSKYASVFAALLTGLVVSPFLEVLKTKTAESTSSRKLRQECVIKLRIAVGYLDAMEELVDCTFDPGKFARDGFLSTGSISWAEVKNFDLSPVTKMIEDLARLDVKLSSVSAVGQSLTKRLLLTVSAFEQIKSFDPAPVHDFTKLTSQLLPRRLGLNEDDKISLITAKFFLKDLRHFIKEIYAKKLNIDGRSFDFDSEINKSDSDFLLSEINSAQQKSQEARKSFSDIYPLAAHPDESSKP